MKLTKEIAEELLQEAWSNPENHNWITHCRCVGATAAAIAKAIGEDAELAEALGMVHDIAKKDRK